ncbi:MAG: PepSY domain-containing protein [Xanthomonadaceae bacterium]|nr:PepSY domain-containing protein [Xanthomonadaceae bacterium]
MIALSQARTKELLAIHGWSAVFLGLLLYAVILTGVVSVFAREIGAWSAPLPAPAGAALLERGLDAALKRLAAEVPAEFHEDSFFFPDTAGRIRSFFHKHDQRAGEAQPLDRGVEFDLDPATLAVLDRREGWSDEIRARNLPSALADFFVELHVSLHLPDPWGLLLTGVLGLAMMLAAVTGFLVHRHLIRELFTLRRNRETLLVRRDAHVIAGTWNLPFAFVLAFTGSFFSFAGSFGIPAIAMVAFGGDQEKLIETVVGTPASEDATPAPFADLDAMLADARDRAGGDAGFVSIAHYGRADALVTVSMFAPDGKLSGATYTYNGASGAFIQQKPTFGLVPSLGNDLFTLMAPLHFGNFAGLWSKAVWFALGFAGAYVTLTGILLWTTRRASEPGWQALARATHWVGYGLPMALAAVPMARFLAPLSGLDIHAAQNLSFIAGVVVASLLGGRLRDLDVLRRALLGVTGTLLVLTPVARWLSGGPGWTTAAGHGLVTVIAIDVAVLLAGLLCLRSAARRPTATIAMPVVATADADGVQTA